MLNISPSFLILEADQGPDHDHVADQDHDIRVHDVHVQSHDQDLDQEQDEVVRNLVHIQDHVPDLEGVHIQNLDQDQKSKLS